MKKHMPYRLATGLIAAVLLAGCSPGSGNTASPSAVTQNAGTGSNSTAVQPGTGEQRPDGMNRSGMNIGKIKSISGSTITLYTGQMPEGRPQNNGEGGQGTPPEGGKDGQQADGQQGTPPAGGAQSGEAGQQDGRRQGGMMQNFSEETTDITVTADTEYVSVTYENGQQKETELTLTDLKADDVIQYTLQTDTATAVKITVGSGGFGFGGGGRGGAPGYGNGQSGTDSSVEAGSAGK
ncbi:hypothetical protein [Paenibacillus typhae]|uniref:DUF5666 domain-containing protein n=1 Tax=Paenibacillus typhae TaxID=1174501 RepID=A0A1G8VJB6_9BACL|nr:hypothetical protein [Paenibacillus typhae]SDJ66049.1 hypothetical protein SAMN05216192_12144 [Paenibacillus typhae]